MNCCLPWQWCCRLWRPLFIFVTAFLLRLFYNTVVLEHRICHFGDAFNYLEGARLLLSWVHSPDGWPLLLTSCLHGLSATGIFQSLQSLPHRLLIDGPVFPLYLSILEWLSHTDLLAGHFDVHCQQYAILNALTDSAACLLLYRAGRLAFRPRVAFLAALLLSLYPPAIINTQHCYSEPFSYFLLTFWICLLFQALLRHEPDSPYRRFLPLWLGISSGLVMLSRPAFVALPPAVASALLPYLFIRLRKQSSLSKATWLCRLALGLSLVLLPWLGYTKVVSGQYSLSVNRWPAFNFYLGNQLSTDGWSARPFPAYIPGKPGEAVTLICREAQRRPVEFLALQLRKVPRLWAGVWNENQYWLPFMGPNLQNLFHQLILLYGFLGSVMILSQTGRRYYSRTFLSGLILSVVIAFHFVYCLFEPISRYAITAMPFAMLLAAYAIDTTCRGTQAKHRRLLGTLALSAVLFCLFDNHVSLIPILAQLSPAVPIEVVASLNVTAWILSIAVLCWSVLPLVERSRRDALVSGITRTGFGFTAIIVVLSACFDPSWREWYTTLSSPEQLVRQDIHIPPMSRPACAGHTAFILVDLSPTDSPSNMLVTFNHRQLSDEPIPWLALQPDHDDMLQLLAIQAAAMGRDPRSFRQWWAFPVDRSLIKFGQTNSIVLRARSGIQQFPRIFGQYGTPESGSGLHLITLPSLSKMSWEKGFATFDHSDPRIQETLSVSGINTGCWRHDSRRQWNDRDLSNEFGIQSGSYRIRLADPVFDHPVYAPLTPPISSDYPLQIVSANARHIVSGNNVPSMFLTPEPLTIQSGAPPGTRFRISCELASLGQPGSAHISLEFFGRDHGKPVAWASFWQPDRIATTADWKAVSLSDIIPDRVLRLTDLRARIVLSPFYPDQLFLHRKQALSSQVAVRNCQFALLPPLDLPAYKQRRWVIY